MADEGLENNYCHILILLQVSCKQRQRVLGSMLLKTPAYRVIGPATGSKPVQARLSDRFEVSAHASPDWRATATSELQFPAFPATFLLSLSSPQIISPPHPPPRRRRLITHTLNTFAKSFSYRQTPYNSLCCARGTTRDG